MGVAQIIVGSLMILASIASMITSSNAFLQQGRRSGIGAISGGIDTFLSKNKARDWDSRLARITKYIAITFFVLAVVANVIALAAK